MKMHTSQTPFRIQSSKRKNVLASVVLMTLISGILVGSVEHRPTFPETIDRLGSTPHIHTRDMLLEI